MVVWVNVHAPVGGGKCRQHLVHVHVRGGAGPCLVGVDWEVVVMSPTDNLLRRRHDRIGDDSIDDAKLLVYDCRRAFDVSESHNLCGLETSA